MQTVFITENLATGLLNTDKPIVYGIVTTAKNDAMGYMFIALKDPEDLSFVGILPEDIAVADGLPVGGTHTVDWPVEKATVIVKLKDDRQKV